MFNLNPKVKWKSFAHMDGRWWKTTVPYFYLTLNGVKYILFATYVVLVENLIFSNVDML